MVPAGDRPEDEAQVGDKEEVTAAIQESVAEKSLWVEILCTGG